MYPEELNAQIDVSVPRADQLVHAVGQGAAAELADARGMISHCLAQLSDEQIWFRVEPSLNSIGNLVLHLTGNLRQWVVSGLGNERDERHRPAEFSEQGPIPRDPLLHELDRVVEAARQVLLAITADGLLRTRRIQGFEMQGLAALLHAVPHFRGHTQEIIGMTRRILGSAYRFAWTPANLEQGA